MSSRNKYVGKMDSQEAKLAKKSSTAFVQARESHLARGREVLVVRGSDLVRVKPDGGSEVVKSVESPRVLSRGMRFRVR